jgi:hypothetical protein
MPKATPPSPKPAVFRKPAARAMRIAKRGVAQDAIGQLAQNEDTYILTYGQFSLIDALVALLDQTGPADVVLSSWTAADADLEHTANMVEALAIRDLRMVVDRSFRTRQPAYFRRMRELFGAGCVREIRSHAKFMVITNDQWKVVVRTSMNLNENPRFESIEISTDPVFAEFMLGVVANIFETVPPDSPHSDMPEFADTPPPYKLLQAPIMEFETLSIPRTTHVA